VGGGGGGVGGGEKKKKGVMGGGGGVVKGVKTLRSTNFAKKINSNIIIIIDFISF